MSVRQMSYERQTTSTGEVRATLPYPYCFVVGACWEQRSEFLPGGTKGRNYNLYALDAYEVLSLCSNNVILFS